ncbi:hypothetical protein A3755_14765 [Oleiphilus sp. HI0085]|nr:hypothetical protein A3755_14765 [Oleiphilus sp. HI0085]
MRGVDHVRFTSDIKVLNFLIAIACSLPLVFLSEQVINLFYGEELVAYSLILKFMALALVISSANQVDFNYLNSIGKSKVFFANSVITVFVQIFLIFMLLPIYGVETLVISKFLAVFTGFLIAQYSLYRSGNELHHKLNLVITLIMIYFLAVLERV